MNKIGLIAGGGKFPILFAKEAKKNGFSVYVAGFKDIASHELEEIADNVEYFKLGQLNAVISFFKDNNVNKAAILGLVKHSSMFSGIIPDMRAAKALARVKDMRAKTIFTEIETEFSKDNIELINSAEFLTELIAEKGCLTKRKPDSWQNKNIRLGWKTAKALAELDVGLTVAVCDMAVIALEGMEGTDLCILRAGEILGGQKKRKGLFSKNSGLVIVKVARKRQDFRFDMPVIGKGTIESMSKANSEVLAIESGKTLIIDKEDVIRQADLENISIIAFSDDVI